MHELRLDARTWKTADDVYIALLSALQSFPGHGHNLDALWDSLREAGKYGTGGAEYLNSVQPPLLVEVRNTDLASVEAREKIEAIAKLIDEARSEFDIDVSISLLSSGNRN
jgi:RNAse (barnase) inhibitor barstar